MKCHEVDFEVFGSEMQYVQIELDPKEVVIAESGGMLYMDPGIVMETKMGDGSEPNQGLMGKLFSAGKRMLTGESLFMTHFSNGGSGKQKVAFAAPYPGKIIAVNMAQHQNKLICEKGAFLCAAYGTKVGIQADFTKLGRGLFGGEGFIMQTVEGDGLAILHAGGNILERVLQPGEKLRIDTGCIVAFEPSVEYGVERVKGLKNMFFGGEGVAFAVLTGPGKIWLQTLPFNRLVQRIIQTGIPGGKGAKEEGSVLGKIGNLLDGS